MLKRHESNNQVNQISHNLELESLDKLGKVRTKISSPKYEWEKKDSSINEGPQILKDDKKTFVIFSANRCRSPDYSMGFLSNTDGNYLLATSWKKNVVPLFQKSDKNKVYGPGQATFIKSPDMKDYFVYQAKTTSEKVNNISNSIGRGEAKFVTIGEIMLSSSGDEVANVLTSENEEPAEVRLI